MQLKRSIFVTKDCNTYVTSSIDFSNKTMLTF